MIGIIDYDLGNIFSLRAALGRLNQESVLISQAKEGKDCTGLILPGVGAFGDAMKNLKKRGLDQFLKEWVQQNKPLLGICLGMQLLFESSEEHGFYQGLGILPGQVKIIPSGQKIPHMGWNKLKFKKEQGLLQPVEGFVYFVHSYYADTLPEYLVATTNYGIEIPAVVGQDHVLGMQFHPEKSGQVGMKLLANWVNLIEVSSCQGKETSINPFLSS